jgi:hypothetical protein
MKVEKEFFSPVKITLENQEEVNFLYAILTYPEIFSILPSGFRELYTSLQETASGDYSVSYSKIAESITGKQ